MVQLGWPVPLTPVCAGEGGLPAGLVVDRGEEFGVLGLVVFVEVEAEAQESQTQV